MFWLCFAIRGGDRTRKEFCCVSLTRTNYEVDSKLCMNVSWLFFHFRFFKCSDWSAMFFQYIKLGHLRLSTKRLLLSKIRFEQKAFISNVTDEKNATSILLSLTQQGWHWISGFCFSSRFCLYVCFLYRLRRSF